MEDNNEAQDRLLKFKRDMEKLGLAPVKPDEYVSPLTEASMKVKGAASSANVTPVNNIVKGVASQADVTPIKQIVKGGVDRINTKEVQKLVSGNMFQDKIAKILESKRLAKAAASLGGVASKGLKAVPFIGTAMGLGSALMSGDASAAIPVLDQADNLGPEEGTLESKLESGTITKDELQQLLNRSK